MEEEDQACSRVFRSHCIRDLPRQTVLGPDPRSSVIAGGKNIPQNNLPLSQHSLLTGIHKEAAVDE